jgi:pimeloyl-ACP methyl ester carboxylesterase
VRDLLASFRPFVADLGIDFDFVDAPYPGTPAPGIEMFYRPPYYQFWENDNAEEIQKTRKWLADLIARSGPYDGVMMFSQGCVLGASFLLHHPLETYAELPFKFAIFICGGPSLKDLEALGFSIAPAVWESDRISKRDLSEMASTHAILRHGSERWAELDTVPTVDDVTDEIVGPYQIQIPTVHIIGRKDPRYHSGLHLATLCNPKTRDIYDHGGGHDIPRTDAVSRTIATLVKKAALSAF